jgi:hypothetical protein
VTARLLRHTIAASLLLLFAAAALFAWRGFDDAAVAGLVGFALGCAAAVFNLWMLAIGTRAMMTTNSTVMTVLPIVSGFTLLALIGAVIAMRCPPQMTVGYGFGLAVPAAGGLLLALTMKRAEPPRV